MHMCVFVYVCYFDYFGKFSVTGLIFYVYDNGAIPRGPHLVRRITAWCSMLYDSAATLVVASTSWQNWHCFQPLIYVMFVCCVLCIYMLNMH